MKHNSERAVVCVLGLGYVGLPLVKAFARSLLDDFKNIMTSTPIPDRYGRHV